MNMQSQISAASGSLAIGPYEVDRPFWNAVALWKKLTQQFEDDLSEDDEVWSDYGDRIYAAMLAMLDEQITTTTALMVKLMAIRDYPDNAHWTGHTLWDRVMWDAERLSKKEMFA